MAAVGERRRRKGLRPAPPGAGHRTRPAVVPAPAGRRPGGRRRPAGCRCGEVNAAARQPARPGPRKRAPDPSGPTLRRSKAGKDGRGGSSAEAGGAGGHGTRRSAGWPAVAAVTPGTGETYPVTHSPADRNRRAIPGRLACPPARRCGAARGNNVEIPHPVETSHAWRVFYFRRTKSFHVLSLLL